MATQQQNISKHNFEQCLKCNICTNVCPVYAADSTYPGPKQSGPDKERYRMKDGSFYDKTLKMCLNCKRCEEACPSGVQISDLIQRARIEHETGTPSLRDFSLGNTDLVGSMATLVAPIVNTTLKLAPVKAVMDATIGVSKHRTFPAYASQKFETWFKREAKDTQTIYDRKVAFFHGCYVNYNYPQLGKDLVKILNACGYGIELLENEKCCGVALIANGQAKQARKQGENNLDAMRKAMKNGCEAVLTVGSTCTLTMRDEYAHLLDMDNSDVRENITLATRFLYQLVQEGKIKLAFRPDFKMKAAYHTACHMEKMGWSVYSTGMLRMIPGMELVMLDSQCCGQSGTYGFKKENYERSINIGKPLFDQIAEVNPDLVACDCETCKWQIEMNTPYKVANPISILAEALDVENTRLLNRQ